MIKGKELEFYKGTNASLSFDNLIRSNSLNSSLIYK